MRRLTELAIPLLLLVAWECLVRFGLLPGHTYSTPTGVARRLAELAAAGDLGAAFAASLRRVAGSFLAGAVPGLLTGLALGLFHPVRTALKPRITTWYALLRLALTPLLILLLIPGELSPTTVIAAGLFLLVTGETLAGVNTIEQRSLDVAASFGASPRDFGLTIALPGALPRIFTGLKLGVGMALLLTVAAEMMGAGSGIGHLLAIGYASMDLDGIFVGLTLLAVLGSLLAGALMLLERTVAPWKR